MNKPKGLFFGGRGIAVDTDAPVARSEGALFATVHAVATDKSVDGCRCLSFLLELNVSVRDSVIPLASGHLGKIPSVYLGLHSDGVRVTTTLRWLVTRTLDLGSRCARRLPVT
jgi:hypothetical protein